MPLAVPTLAIADDADGGGGTATVTGGNALATNVLKAGRFTGNLGAISWTTAGTRTGPGAVAFTVSAVGMYLFAVESTLAAETVWSSVHAARISDAADSLHEQLQQAVLDRILALSLDGIGSKVRRMKFPPEGRIGIPLPVCLLMTFDQQEDFLDSRSTNASDDTAFPVLVAFLSNMGAADETDGRFTLWRQQVRRAFRAQRLDVGRHYTTEFSPGPVVAVAAEGEKIQASTMTLKLICREPRGVGA